MPGVRWLLIALTCLAALRIDAADGQTVAARDGMVVSAHRLASQVGVDVLRRGGNAVDAAVAVGYALAVVYPVAGNLGGGGFMTIRLADGRSTFLDFRETAPLAATERMYLDELGAPRAGASTLGHLAVGVPGSVAGLEVDLAGTYDLPVGDRTVTVTLRGIADRVDLLGDGTLRVVDYKSGHAPEVRRALQLPVYGFCAERRLAGEHGRAWRLGEAAYIAFGEKRPWVTVIASPDDRDAAVADALGRLAAAVAGITRGDFPPNPVPRTLCATCAFAAVCRKDYVDAG